MSDHLDTPCILWSTKITGPNPYGQARRNGQKFRAHRLAWMDAHGPIPDGLIVRHKCDNPPCVNLDHLELGTHQDNTRDRFERGRARPKRGSSNPSAKLTEAQVLTIRSVYVPRHPVFGGAALGRKYGVASTVITKIMRGEIWRYV